LSCALGKRTANICVCRAPLRKRMAKVLFCRAFYKNARQTSFPQFYKIQENYQINFKNAIKLIQTNLCYLLLVETRFDDKTQFECRVTYKFNHIFRNSTKLHRRYFEKQISYMKKCSNLIHELHIGYHELSTNLMIFMIRG
jgi:hypothetical protein